MYATKISLRRLIINAYRAGIIVISLIHKFEWIEKKGKILDFSRKKIKNK